MSVSPTEQRATGVMVSVRGLTKVYHARRGDVQALRNVALDIHRGEMLVLLGPSGCGKTTLLRCIAGLEQPTAGDIEVHGRTVFSSVTDVSLPPEKRHLSMVFQSYALWPHMTVSQNVAYPLTVSRVADAELRERVAKVLSMTGLERQAQSYPGQLSGGQQQRVALARALVASEGLILFDEPLSNLDAKVRERLRDELIAMQQEFGFTGIYVTHDQTEAAALASRIAVFGHGQIEQLGIPQHVFNAPGSGYVADFVGFTNELAGVVCGCGQQQAQVDTAVGRLFATSSDGQLRDGQRVRVMFRPEHVEVTRLAGNGVNRLRAVVERSMFLGAHVEHRLNVGGQRMSQRAPGSEPLMAGDQVDIILNPDSIRAYAAD